MSRTASARPRFDTNVQVQARPRAAEERRLNALLTAAMVISDAVLINAAFALAWYARYELQLGRELLAAGYTPYMEYFSSGLGLTAVLLLVFAQRGLYGRLRGGTWLDQATAIFEGATIALAVFIVVTFYLRQFDPSRVLFVYSWAAIILVLSCSRLIEHMVRGYLRQRGIGLKRVLVVGAGSQGMRVMQNMVAQPHLGYEVVGFLDDVRQQDIGRFPALGSTEEVRAVASLYDVDQVIIALPSASHHKIMQILGACREEQVDFLIVPDFYELSLRQVSAVPLNGIPLIGLRQGSIGGWNQAAKRLMDVTMSLSALALLSPLLAMIALAIKLDSKGPVLVKQQRVGRGGKTFDFYKFRSMHENADRQIESLMKLNEVQGPIFKMRNDPRRTRVGRILRRTSLDELPQLYNVLRGDMSLVGPRPPLPSEVEKYEDWHRRRLDVSPGLTGLWQVSGRSKLGFDEMALLDIWYIDNWSLGLDLKIMLRTVPAVLLATGAY